VTRRDGWSCDHPFASTHSRRSPSSCRKSPVSQTDVPAKTPVKRGSRSTKNSPGDARCYPSATRPQRRTISDPTTQPVVCEKQSRRQARYIEPMRRANAKLRFEAEQKLIRFEHVIKLQMAEIAKLRDRCPNLPAGYLPKPGIERIQQDQSSNRSSAIRTAQAIGGSFSSWL